MAQRSHIEVGGWVACHYDVMMDLLLLGRYQAFIEEAIGRMELRHGDAILDLGSGTGRNICVILESLGSTGRVVGVDINQEMLRQARQRCRIYHQVTFLEHRIEEPLPFREEFDTVFITFTLHGFEDEDKERVIANAYWALRPGGTFWVLDYNEFDLRGQWFPFRWAFRRFECELASEFLSLDLEEMLARQRFGHFVSYSFLWGYVRLLGAEKLRRFEGRALGLIGGLSMRNSIARELDSAIMEEEHADLRVSMSSVRCGIRGVCALALPASQSHLSQVRESKGKEGYFAVRGWRGGHGQRVGRLM